ncbi:MAG: PKD domain-containing protein, partial [Bacteroidota bacterium]
MKRTILLFSLFIGMFSVRATHILGGDIRYTCLDSTQHIYQIDVTLFRDCLNGQAPFDNVLSLFFFDTLNDSLLKIEQVIYSGVSTFASPLGIASCALPFENYCSEVSVYSLIDTLPPRLGGYLIGWSRCCFSNILVNGVGQQGFTLTTQIPGSEKFPANSQPEVLQKSIHFLCQDEIFEIDLQATDPEGDSLVYSIDTLRNGMNLMGFGTNQFTAVVNALNPMGPPPYEAYSWQPGYSVSDPLGTGYFSLDPQLGKLYGRAGGPGAYIYSIAVEEFRNGISLGSYSMVLQFYLVDCGATIQSWAVNPDYGMLNTTQDTIFASDDSAFCFVVDLDSVPAGEQIDLQISAISNLAEWSLSQDTANPLQYDLCWTPSCSAWPDTLLSLVLESSIDSDCPLDGFRLDTIYLRLSASGNMVQGPAPQADFSVSNDENSYFFESQSLYAGSFLWDFGDDAISTLRDPFHIYSSSGIYDVQLIVRNDCGSDTIQRSIGVSLTEIEAPKALVLRLWPNPVQDHFVLQLSEQQADASLK